MIIVFNVLFLTSANSESATQNSSLHLIWNEITSIGKTNEKMKTLGAIAIFNTGG
jgi:hypothetical protein